MATLSRLTPGQIVYSVQRQRMGNTTMRRTVIYEVRIVEVKPLGVMASWNYNRPEYYPEHSVRRWKVKRPEVPHA